jgi:protein TonB
LLNLEARTLFEWRVACLLAQGWRPGHEFLFTPACRTFEWDADRRRLALFGSVGATLDAAIQQRMIFYKQSKLDFDTQRAVIRRLRSEEAPSPGELGSMSQRLRLLVQRYPHWLPIITSAANVRRWGELSQQSAAQPAPSKDIPIPEALRPAPPPRSHQGWVWGGVAGFILVLRGLAAAIGGGGEPPRIVHNPPSASSDWPARPPATSWSDLSRPTMDPLDGGTMTVPSSEIAPSPLAPPRGHADLLLHGPNRQAKPATRDRAKSLQQRQQDMEQALREAGLTPAAPASGGTPSRIAPGDGLRGGDLLPTPGTSPLGDPWKKP